MWLWYNTYHMISVLCLLPLRGVIALGWNPCPSIVACWSCDYQYLCSRCDGVCLSVCTLYLILIEKLRVYSLTTAVYNVTWRISIRNQVKAKCNSTTVGQYMIDDAYIIMHALVLHESVFYWTFVIFLILVQHSRIFVLQYFICCQVRSLRLSLGKTTYTNG